MRSINRVNTNPGVGLRVKTPQAVTVAAANWWDPNNVGLSIVGAYRAISSVGTPWPGGPTNYAESKVNQSNPGINDLIEGNGAVTWNVSNGWSFTFAATQWLDTALIPSTTWSIFVQFANGIAGPNFRVLTGVFNNATDRFSIIQNTAGGSSAYTNGNVLFAPALYQTGNMAISNKNAYRNGLPDGAIPAGGTVPALTLWIGARNGGAAGYYDGDIYAVAIYNANPAQVQSEALSIVTAMSQL